MHIYIKICMTCKLLIFKMCINYYSLNESVELTPLFRFLAFISKSIFDQEFLLFCLLVCLVCFCKAFLLVFYSMSQILYYYTFYLSLNFDNVISIIDYLFLFYLIIRSFEVSFDFIALNNKLFWKIMKCCKFCFIKYMFRGLAQMGCPHDAAPVLPFKCLGFGLWHYILYFFNDYHLLLFALVFLAVGTSIIDSLQE